VYRKWRTSDALRCRRDYHKREKNVKKNSIGLICRFGGLWKWHLTGQLFRNKCIKLSLKLPLIVYIITKYKITHYQYPILHNREFRSLGNRKNYLKFTKATLQGNDVREYFCLHCTIIFAIIDFFPYFFHVHLFSKLSRTHSKSRNNDFVKFKQCERVILTLTAI
jgi:hypothetical protein